jgi:BED zinc finger
MGPGLNFETTEEIDMIQIDARAETQNPNVPEQPTKKRKCRERYSDVWKHFKRGKIGDDDIYDAICNYCEKCYKQGNQRSTSSLKYHITKGCKKILWAVRHNKLDAL